MVLFILSVYQSQIICLHDTFYYAVNSDLLPLLYTVDNGGRFHFTLYNV